MQESVTQDVPRRNAICEIGSWRWACITITLRLPHSFGIGEETGEGRGCGGGHVVGGKLGPSYL